MVNRESQHPTPMHPVVPGIAFPKGGTVCVPHCPDLPRCRSRGESALEACDGAGSIWLGPGGPRLLGCCSGLTTWSLSDLLHASGICQVCNELEG